MSVSINEPTNQVIVTDPNGAIKVVSVGLRGPAGEPNVGNLQVGVGSLQNEITVRSEASRDLILSANATAPGANIVIASNMVPIANSVFSLGTPEYQWKDIFVSDGTIYIGTTSSISSASINLNNFNVAADGSISIPGVNIAADANSINTVTIVASDLASNTNVQEITGYKVNLLTENKSNLVSAINELYDAVNSVSSGAHEALAANLNVVSSNVDSLALIVDSVSSNVDSLSIIVDSVSANADIVSSNVNALSLVVDSVSSNVDSLSIIVDSVSSNVDSLSIIVDSVSSNVDSVSANLGALSIDVDTISSNLNALTDSLVTTSANIGDIIVSGSTISSNTDTLIFSDTNVLIQGNLVVEGTTTHIDSIITTLNDPILTLGGNAALNVDDGSDRGIEFRYYETDQSKLGFIGYDKSANSFTLLLDATNVEEQFSGTTADLIVNNILSRDITASSISANNFTGNLTGNVTATSITTHSLLSNNFTTNTLTANIIVGTIQGNITGNLIATTANVGSLEVQTINGLAFPTEDGLTGQILSTDGSGSLIFINDNAGSTDGTTLYLGQPDDESYLDGAYKGLTADTTIANAIDFLNESLENIRKGTFVKLIDFTANVLSGNSPLAIALSLVPTGNVTQYEISWGDGSSNTTTSSTTVNHTYNVALGGLQTITVTGLNTNGTGEGSQYTKTALNYISIATPTPIPSFSLADDTLDSGSSVSLTNGSVYADSYEISWGDGSSNTSLGATGAGTPNGGAIAHQYTNSGGDQTYTITLTAFSSSNGQDVSTTDSVYVYSTHTPTFTANTTTGYNEEATSGLPVLFTNTTSSGVGVNSAYPDAISYLWTWGDGTTTSVVAGSAAAGDASKTITHTFALTNRTVAKTFQVQLQVFNGHSLAPFASANTSITVSPDPRSEFTGSFLTTSAGLNNSSVRRGYIFTGYNGNKRNVVSFQNQSENSTDYEWNFGDASALVTLTEGEVGTPTGGPITHEYTSIGNYTVSLNVPGDLDSRSAYISILANPAPPSTLSTKSITMTAEDSGNNPLLTANFDDNTGGAIASPGADLPRTLDQLGYITTDVLSTYSLGSNSGILSAVVNGVVEGSKTFTSGDDSGTYASLVINSDIDANGINQQGAPAIPNYNSVYPTGFYRVFKASINKSATGLTDGLNSFKLSHSETGATNTIEFIKESLSEVPVLDLATATLVEKTTGTKKYISGVPYYNTGGIVSLVGTKVYNWIDQTYRGIATPFEIAPATNDEATTGDAITPQGSTYAQLNGSPSFLLGGVPIKQTGINSSNKYTLGNIDININGSARAVETLKFRMLNVTGTGSYNELSDTKVQIYSTAITGFNEEIIPVSSSLGASYTDAAKRIVISGASGATPTLASATNYFSTNPWTGPQTIAGTDEAVVRWDVLQHFITDFSTGYLPVGPNLATGRSGTQYFRAALRRSNVSNFIARISGKISSFHIALPGTGIDSTSALNGWLDANTLYEGIGQPGSNIGGNGGDGCAFGNVIPLGTILSNAPYTLTFGTESSSNATGNQIIISIGLASGDYITALSFEETS